MGREQSILAYINIPKKRLKGKLYCMDCTRTMTQCMSLHVPDQIFPNAVEGCGKSPLSGGECEILLREFNLYGSGNLRRSDFDHLNLFKAKTSIL